MTDLSNGFLAVNYQMITIPAGEIEMRDDRTKRRWTVKLKPFLLGRFPVTQDLYYEITKKSPSNFKGGKLPVETVSWKDAILFCNLLSVQTGLNTCYTLHSGNEKIDFNELSNGFRLPNEAEWEYACKAGSAGVRYGDLDLIAWYKDNSQGTTQNIGMKEPNAWGLNDMLGNVWEWCTDIYDETVYGSYRIFRGGGWCDDARGCMATNRRRSHPTSFKIDDLGFRIAKNIVNQIVE
jgi:formylglycine-generating enzyme required for sulfatase activity